MYDILYPKQPSIIELMLTRCETCLKIMFRAILFLLLFGFAIYFTVNYFTDAYHVSSSIRASMPSMALFHIFNIAFCGTSCFALVYNIELT